MTCIAAILLLWLAVALLFPYCQYYIDPDAVAYLTVSKRYATGDLWNAINGYWSPWACWLTAAGIRSGLPPFTAAIVVNTLGATGFLWISSRILFRFDLLPLIQVWLHLVLVIFLASAVYLQSFADLWQCFFLLWALLLMLSDSFRRKPTYWVLYGVAGTLAYLSKAYSFSFFILQTICCGFLVMRAWEKGQRKIYARMVIASLLTLFFLSAPWMYLLQAKYGSWMTSTAGKLNLSWYLTGTPFYQDEIVLFLPPPYHDSPYYWEDPYFSNGATPHFYTSFAYLKMQVVRMGYTLLKLVNSLNAFSAFALPTWLLSLLILLPTRLRQFFPTTTRTVALSLLLFPTGFLLINFEPRYIWYTYPLTLLVAALAIQHLLPLITNRYVRWLTVLLFAFSFIADPVWQMKPLIHAGRAEYELAQTLKKHGITGSFATNALTPQAHQRAARIAWFSGNPYYFTPANTQHAQGMLHEEIDRYGIRYFIYLTDLHTTDTTFSLRNAEGIPYPEALQGNGKMKVFLLQPQIQP